MATAQPDRHGSELDAILAAYLEEAEAGRAPDRIAWLQRHPDHRAELSAFFANLDHVDRLAHPGWTQTWTQHAAGPADLIPFPAPADQPGKVAYFGEYELIRELGRGGMGVVYAARQASLDRVLAIKLLATRSGSAGDVQRFLREAVAAAGLDHPNIVPIYEVGEHDGRHYYGMKLIDGGSLSQHAERLRDDPQTAAALLARVARAVQYAHERGVLHRDLKPANVLLDRLGTPYVADFGLARRVDGDAGITTSGLVVGSPAYMAPEQAEGRRDAVTTAADVYGLGAILYELLAGRPPFSGDSVLEVLTCVRDAEPEPPSRIHPGTPRDLETIALKCLEKSPSRRYPSAAALADDLERWIAGEPILARPVSARERIIKWARRRPAVAALGAISTLVIAASAIIYVSMYQSMTRREEFFRSHIENQSFKQAAIQEAQRAASYGEHIVAASASLAENQVTAADQWLDLCPPELRHWEWSHLSRLGHSERLTIQGHNGVACQVAFAPDPTRFTCPDEHGGLTIWEAATSRKVAHLRGHDGTVYGSAFDRAGSRLATAGSDGFLRIWDVKTSALLRSMKAHEQWAASVSFDPAGRRLASAGQDGFVRIWDADNGRELHAWDHRKGAVLGVAFSPDGSLIASANQDGSIRLRDTTAGVERRSIMAHAQGARCVAFSPDGRLVASGGGDRFVKVFDVASGHERLRFQAADARVDGLAFSPDGRTLATGGLDRSVRAWNAADGKLLASYLGHGSPVFSVAFSPDGQTLASAAQDGTVKLWDARNAPGTRLLRPGVEGDTRTTSVSFSPDGQSIAVSRQDMGIDVFSLGASQGVASIRNGATVAAYRPGKGTLASIPPHGPIEIASPTDPKSRLHVGIPSSRFGSLAFSGDGSTLVTGDGMPLEILQSIRGKSNQAPRGRYLVRSWDPNTGTPIRDIAEHDSPIVALATNPDGSEILSADAGGTVRLNAPGTGTRLTLAEGRESPVLAIAHHPTQPIVAWAGADGKIQVLDRRANHRSELTGHDGWITSLAFSPDGRRLASASFDGTVRIWDVEQTRQLLSLRGPGRRLTSVAFSPDGRTLAASADDGSAALWPTGP